MGKNKNVPAIRFKGFAEEWEEKIMDKIGNTFTGLSGKTKDDFGHGNAEFITYLNVFTNPIGKRSGTERVEIDKKQNSVQYGDVFFTTSSETPEEVGMSSVWLNSDENVYLNSFCFGYRLNETADYHYLAYLLRCPSIRKKITFLAQGISRYNISKKKMMEMGLPFPDATGEQEKIGDFFKNIDNLIGKNEQRLAKLKNIKKACLEKMFPRKGSTIPEIRFKGFTEEWEEKKLGEMAPLRGGFAFESSQYKDIGIPIIRISNILANGSIGGEFVFYRNLPESDNFLLENGSVLLAMSGATTGKVAELSGEKYNKYYQNQRVGLFTKSTKIDYSFVSTIVRSSLFMDQLRNVLVAGAQPNVSAKDIDSFEYSVPIEKDEQEKIGNFFKNLDNLISKNEQQLEKLKNIKKACLEKMFVNTEDAI